jgi:hypothetical protein
MIRTVGTPRPAANGTTVEQIEREPIHTRAGVLEIVSVGLGVAGWVIAGMAGWFAFVIHWPPPWWGTGVALFVMAFFLTIGWYAIQKFGRDDLQNPARIDELEKYNAELLAQHDADRKTIETLWRELGEFQRPLNIVGRTEKRVEEPAVLQHARKLVDRARLGMEYDRDTCAGLNVMTQGEWTRAMKLLESARMIAPAGVGGRKRAIRIDVPPEAVIEAARAAHMEQGKR